MYQGLVSVLGAIGLTLIWFYILKAPFHFKKWTGLNMQKPFSCAFCMSFWICFFSLLVKTNLLEAIFISSITPFMYLYVEDLITNKWEL